MKFQDEGPGLQRRHRRTSRVRGSSPTGSTTAAVVKREGSSGSGILTPEIIAEDALAMMRSHVTSIDESLSPALIRKHFLSQQPRLFMDFTCAAFPTLYFHNRFRSTLSFPDYIIGHFGTRPYQDSAVCCLSAVYLAHLTKDARLLRASRHMYADALRKINRALDTDAALSDDVLSTVMMLVVFEMYAQTTRDAWVQHARAVKHMFLRRGAKRHMSGFGRSCYYAFRGFLVAHALYEGEPCFLDEAEWQDFATKVRAEDSKKPGEWSVFVDISEMIFMELVQCPRYVHEARAITQATPHRDVVALTGRIRQACANLRRLGDELLASVMYHFQQRQGIEVAPDGFVGPAPAMFPDTNPTLLLQGANTAIDTLEQILRTMKLDHAVHGDAAGTGSPRVLEEVFSPTPSADSTSETISASSEAATPENAPTLTLPFRIVSEIGRGPSHTEGKGGHRAVVWLDRIACSMGMLGAEIVEGDATLTTVVEAVEE
jgi:hypothetical protein